MFQKKLKTSIKFKLQKASNKIFSFEITIKFKKKTKFRNQNLVSKLNYDFETENFIRFEIFGNQFFSKKNRVKQQQKNCKKKKFFFFFDSLYLLGNLEIMTLKF